MLACHLYILTGRIVRADLQIYGYLDLRLERFEAFAACNLPALELAA